MPNGSYDNRIKSIKMNIDGRTPIWQLNVEELSTVIKDIFANLKQAPELPATENIENAEKELVYGINGLAKILGCSKTHASRLKSQGLFDEAIIQRGRKIIIDKEKALKVFNQKE